MTEDATPQRLRRVLNPVDRISEGLSGLLVALTFTFFARHD